MDAVFETYETGVTQVSATAGFLKLMPAHQRLALAARLVEDVAFDRAGAVDVAIIETLIHTAAKLETYAKRR
jgi:hypothetical protein